MWKTLALSDIDLNEKISNSQEKPELGTKENPIKFISNNTNNGLLELLKKRAERQGIYIDIRALKSGESTLDMMYENSVDLSYGMTLLSLVDQNAKYSYDIVPVGSFNAPKLNLYGNYNAGIKDISDIKNGDTILLPEEFYSTARSLCYLNYLELITLKTEFNAYSDISDVDISKSKVKLEIPNTGTNVLDIFQGQNSENTNYSAAFLDNKNISGLRKNYQNNVIDMGIPDDFDSRRELLYPYVGIFYAPQYLQKNEAISRLIQLFYNDEVIHNYMENYIVGKFDKKGNYVDFMDVDILTNYMRDLESLKAK
jgi:D-methionine transport system substrate-binding protein